MQAYSLFYQAEASNTKASQAHKYKKLAVTERQCNALCHWIFC